MTKVLKILAPAKINLSLDVLKITPSGYHKIQTIFQEIPEIYDEIEILSTKNSDNTSIEYSSKFLKTNRLVNHTPNIPVISSSPDIAPAPAPSIIPASTVIPAQAGIYPLTSPSLPHQALLLLEKTYKITNKFAQIKILKNIPFSSGLGGMASDAAAVLKGLNQLWNLKISRKKLLKLATKLGKDIPFFIIGGTALGTNFGEKIKPLKPIKNLKFKIHLKSSTNPEKTKNTYQKLDLRKCAKNLEKTKKLLAAIENGNFEKIIANLHNDFEQLYPLSKNHHLSGSGPSTFTASI